ncbi:hypothetical protein IF803_39790 [Bradyrhizobium sp. UFLA06-06]
MQGSLGDWSGETSIWSAGLLGIETLRGIPVLFGGESGPDALLLRPDEAPVHIELEPTTAMYVIFV